MDEGIFLKSHKYIQYGSVVGNEIIVVQYKIYTSYQEVGLVVNIIKTEWSLYARLLVHRFEISLYSYRFIIFSLSGISSSIASRFFFFLCPLGVSYYRLYISAVVVVDFCQCNSKICIARYLIFSPIPFLFVSPRKTFLVFFLSLTFSLS